MKRYLAFAFDFTCADYTECAHTNDISSAIKSVFDRFNLAVDEHVLRKAVAFGFSGYIYDCTICRIVWRDGAAV